MNRVAVVLLAMTFSAPAFAYLDPGSGSAIVSAIIGFFVAVGMAVKTYWYKIKSWFGKKDPAEQQDSDNDQQKG